MARVAPLSSRDELELGLGLENDQLVVRRVLYPSIRWKVLPPSLSDSS